MDLFISTFDVKIDDKGRVSVPSHYRALIERKGGVIVGYQSFLNECIEVCTQARMIKMSQYIEALDIFSNERDILSTAVLASSEQFIIDAKGRITLPQQFREYAALKDDAYFVGKGSTFEIWNKKLFIPYFEKARNEMKNNKLQLK